MSNIIDTITAASADLNEEVEASQESVSDALTKTINAFNTALDDFAKISFEYNEAFKEYTYQTTLDVGILKEKMKEKIIEVINDELE